MGDDKLGLSSGILHPVSGHPTVNNYTLVHDCGTSEVTLYRHIVCDNKVTNE